MGVPHYAIHHNKAYFPDSHAYKPERWIVDPDNGVSKESVAIAQSAYCSFSIGPRGCVVRGLAMMEIMIVVARLVWLYDMRIAEGTDVGEGKKWLGEGRTGKGELQMRDLFVGQAEGRWLSFGQESGGWSREEGGWCVSCAFGTNLWIRDTHS